MTIILKPDQERAIYARCPGEGYFSRRLTPIKQAPFFIGVNPR